MARNAKRKILKIVPHTPAEVRSYAALLGTTEAHLGYIETQRERYILWEHDYIQTHTQSQEEAEPGRD